MNYFSKIKEDLEKEIKQITQKYQYTKNNPENICSMKTELNNFLSEKYKMPIYHLGDDNRMHKLIKMKLVADEFDKTKVKIKLILNPPIK